MDTQPSEGMIERQPKKRRGCFFWGCMTMLLLLLAVGGCIGVGYFVIRDQWTSTEGKPMPPHQPKPGEYEDVKRRLGGFDDAARADRPARLELTADDLNTLIASDPEIKQLAGKVFVHISGSEVFIDFSLPLKDLPLPLLGGRWVNGTAQTEISIADGKLVLTPRKITVNDKAISDEFLESLQPFLFKLLNSQNQSKEFQEHLKKAKSLEVRDGKIVITR